MPRSADQPVTVPGAVAPAAEPSPADQIAALQAELAAAKAQLASVAQQPVTDETVVYEPKTRHGAQALAASAFAGMTTTEVHAKVRAGKITLGRSISVLCSDGYYCNPIAT